MGRVGERVARKLFQEELLAQGLDYWQVAEELAGRYGLRPRAAFREAHGWSLLRHEAQCHIARAAGRDGRRLSLDLMAYLDLKGEGDSSMPGNRWPCPGVRDGVPGDPRDMAKAGLP